MPFVEVLLTSFDEVIVSFFDLQETAKITNIGKIIVRKKILILNFNTVDFNYKERVV